MCAALHFVRWALALGLFVPLAARPAEPPPGVDWSVAVEALAATQAADGTVQFEIVAVSDVAAAEEFVYSVRFTNLTEQAVDGVRVTSAIPPSLRYVAASATGPGSLPLFSVDGGLTFGAPGELVVVANEQLRIAAPDDYTHVRWLLVAPLEGGATGFVRFRATRR
jgi:uncharacterized repeat protein (TIGR01451 family)